MDDDEETSSVGSCSTATENTSRSETPTSIIVKGKRGRKGRKRKTTPPNCNAPFKYNCHIREDHGKEIFGVQFNNYLKDDDVRVFAAVGKNRVTVYECPSSGGLNVLMVFVDPNNTEVFYSCAWSYNEEGWPLLAVAGMAGVVRVINTATGACIRNFIGHGAAVNELKFHPKDPSLLLSASKDHTLRLWNVRTHVCIAILGSVEGHRDEVLSADFDSDGDKIMSCGIDHALKLWRLDKKEVRDAIAASHRYHKLIAKRPFNTYLMHFPDFSTRDIHMNYVDCVRWLGDIVLSKSCDNSIICWKPGRLEDRTLRLNETKWTLIHRFEYSNCELWFMRFSLDFDQKMVALGNGAGKIYLWNLENTDPAQSEMFELMHPKCVTSVRQISMHRDSSVLVAVCDDATVWRWDRVNTPVKIEASLS